MEKSGDKTGQLNLVEEQSKKKFSAVDLAMKKLSNKIFELELVQAIVEETVAKVKIREKEVADEIRKLGQLQYERWESRNDFCEKIWKFSDDYDVIALYNRYLDTPKWIPREPLTFDENQDPNVFKLKTELKELENKLVEKREIDRSLNEKIMQTKIQLQITKFYGDKDTEIIRLKNDIDDYEKKYYDLESKIATMELNFVDWPESPKIPTMETKRSFVTASELIAQHEHKDDIKRSKFSVKRESAILRKFTDKRGSARRT